ncbi:uncharacterized protein LOC133743137 [Rosa rugosa]|uniref:uncharacterized protein LOC133743137 n=1 Tax=Rosa rugosa TaxID=74645 RepID=UPI002B404990|nr:uncharacterized protein LOC133743137 [Rosa rugosa]
MEVEACRAGLLLGIYQGWSDVDIESDSIILITALKNEEEDLSVVAASSLAPQFWLADTGATNHMTNNPHVLTNATPYLNTDSVQIGDGQGTGQNSLSGTE